MDAAPRVLRHLQRGVGRRVQYHICAVAVGCLQGRVDQRVHDLLQPQQPLRVVVGFPERDALLRQRRFKLAAKLPGELQTLGGQTVEMIGQAVPCVVHVQLHHLMELHVVLRKGSGNRQEEDDRRKDHEDHGHPVEHQLSLHTHALPFGKGVQRPELPQLIQHGVSSFPMLSLHQLPESLEPFRAYPLQPGLTGVQIVLTAQRELSPDMVLQCRFKAQIGLQLRRHIKLIVCLRF